LILQIRTHYEETGGTLNERQRRLWAATEAMKLGRGGIAVISKALQISPNTIRKGIAEIFAGQIDVTSAAETRVRKVGGGRKPSQHAVNPPEGS
jgi:hypothetical protein